MFNQLLDMAEGIVTTPKAAPVKQKVRSKKVEVAEVENLETAEIVEETSPEPRQLAGSSLHVGASTQELIDEIMKKWKL